MMTPQIMNPVLKPSSGVAAVLDDAAHDVGRQQPRRRADSGADRQQRPTLCDWSDFANDRIADDVDDRRQRNPDRRQRDLDAALPAGTA